MLSVDVKKKHRPD